MWSFREVLCGVGEFHQMEHPGRREVWLHCWEGAEGKDKGALVLGSSQPIDVARSEALDERGLMLVKRQSGGGAVLVESDSLVWIDVFIPRDDLLWEADIGKSAHWVGKVWQDTLAEFGVLGEVHRGRYEPGRWGNLICFAGRATGEVFVEGKKSVGISQRRTKQGARFQTALVRRWKITDLSSLLNLTSQDRTNMEIKVASAAHPLLFPPAEIFATFCTVIQQ